MSRAVLFSFATSGSLFLVGFVEIAVAQRCLGGIGVLLEAVV